MYGYVTECFDILFVLLQTFNEQAHYRHRVHARTCTECIQINCLSTLFSSSSESKISVSDWPEKAAVGKQCDVLLKWDVRRPKNCRGAARDRVCLHSRISEPSEWMLKRCKGNQRDLAGVLSVSLLCRGVRSKAPFSPWARRWHCIEAKR